MDKQKFKAAMDNYVNKLYGIVEMEDKKKIGPSIQEATDELFKTLDVTPKKNATAEKSVEQQAETEAEQLVEKPAKPAKPAKPVKPAGPVKPK